MKEYDAIILSSTFNQEVALLKNFLFHLVEISKKTNQIYQILPVLVLEKSEEDKALKLLKLLEEFGIKDNVKILINENGIGFSSCLNYGINNTNSKYIFRLDTDDRCLPKRLVKQLKIMENQNLDFSNGYMYDENKKILKYPLNKLNIISHIALGMNPIAHPTICIRRSILKINYNEKLQRAEDFDLWIIFLISKDINWQCIKEPLVVYNTYNARNKDKQNALAQIYLRLKYSSKLIIISLALILGIFPNLIRFFTAKNLFLQIRRRI